MSLESMAEGARRIVELADQIDDACNSKRIRMIDIGKQPAAPITSSILDFRFASNQLCWFSTE